MKAKGIKLGFRPSLILIILHLVFFISCGKSDNPEPSGGNEKPQKEFTVTPNSISFEDDGGTKTITIKATNEISFTQSEGTDKWCHVTKSNQGLKVTTDQNDGNSPRKSTITISSSGFPNKKVEIIQLGWEKSIIISTKAITIDSYGGTKEFTITSNCKYNIDIKYNNESETDWITLVPKTKATHKNVSTKEQIKVKLNPNKEKRYAKLIISSGSGSSSSSSAASNNYTSNTTANATANSNSNSIKIYYSSEIGANGIISKDKLDNTIQSKSGDESIEITKEIKITQEAYSEYQPDSEIDIKDDHKIKVKAGRASSYQNGEGIEKSFDGDMNSIWHSNWNNDSDNYFPITIEYDFNTDTQIDYFIYYPRKSHYNGLFKETEIFVKCRKGSQAGKFVKLFDYDFKGSSVATKIEIKDAIEDLNIRDIETIRIIINSGAGDRQGFASCAEMEFYKYAEGNFDPLTLFTDSSCSELKEGITQEDIMNCKFSFFKRIALYMFNNDYPREYRIGEYQAYPNPNIMSRSNKTSQYGFLDNVTGMYVNKGEELVVFTGPLHNRPVTLCIQNLDKPEGEGFWQQQKYPLSEGINKFTTTDKGLIYIIYQPEDYDIAPDIKIHIATGHINGCFDLRTQTKGEKKGQPKHSDGEWTNIINNAKFKYFDIIADKVHLTFPTEKFKEYTKNGGALGRAWNSIVQNEWELMGLYKYPERQFKHRMHCIVMYKSFMYASNFYTAYNVGTLKDIANENKLTTSSCWGPAHEIGHVNQTRPGFLWTGTTEVTNNVMSEYIQTAVFKQKSRLQKERMGEFVNRYSKAWYSAIVRRDPHCILAYNPNNVKPNEGVKHDVFCKLVPFWQLQLYMGEVLKESPMYKEDKGGFYPRLYELIRTEPNQPNPGMQQTEFVILACKAAKLNLLDFFTEWGFLCVTDEYVDDYTANQLTVTEERIQEVRDAVEALGYPKPDGPVQYITDLNKEYFKTKAPIEKGTSSRNGNVLNMNNWKNVVVYEVVNSNNEIVHVSEGKLGSSYGASFKVKGGWQDDYKVYAVSATGDRVLVTF